MLIDELKAIVGDNGWKTAENELEPHLTERRGAVRGRTLIMLSPASVDEVSSVMVACASAGVSVVPQGGNTGLCGGAIPDDSGDQVLLLLSRLNRIRSIDPDDFSMVAEAGCVLAHLQEAAQEADRLFPLSLGAEGSCQIGGNLSTNAGGINVIRYGTARQLVLGLEVVLADGTIWDGLRSLRKDAAGYDLKQLFLGSEGTLGIITAATLRLFPEPPLTTTAMVAVPSTTDAIGLLGRIRIACSDRIQAFELISDRALQLALRHIPEIGTPFEEPYAWYVLLEIATGEDASILESALAAAIEAGQARDAVLAKNIRDANSLWRLRHAIPDAQASEGASLKHDISVPIGRIDEFLSRAEQTVLDVVPDARLVTFGHLGDGNLHYNVTQPIGADSEEFRRQGRFVADAIYDLVSELGGSFSAEHGIGTLKRDYLRRYRSKTEIELMCTLKRALDPNNTLNPGKVI
jgi:FAD/FMN-containing dehydrogenase